MSQHFLLTSKSQTASIMDIFHMNDDQVWEAFKYHRWLSTKGEPVCPVCGGIGHSLIQTRKLFKCSHCRHQYSVTSGTTFAYHKKPLRVYLLAILLYANAVKGISALQLKRDLGTNYQTMFVMAHKIRDALLQTNEKELLRGTIEMDGAYTGKYIRPKNRKKDRIDLRKVKSGNERCALVARERGNNGAVKTRVMTSSSENIEDISTFAASVIEKGSTVVTDENPSYNPLVMWYDLKRVNHKVEYCTEEGNNTNQAESFFMRFRKLEYGQHHHIDKKYLLNYLTENAYREDYRRVSNGDMTKDILHRCLNTPTSPEWCGYWQGNHRMAERRAA